MKLDILRTSTYSNFSGAGIADITYATKVLGASAFKSSPPDGSGGVMVDATVEAAVDGTMDAAIYATLSGSLKVTPLRLWSRHDDGREEEELKKTLSKSQTDNM